MTPTLPDESLLDFAADPGGDPQPEYGPNNEDLPEQLGEG